MTPPVIETPRGKVFTNETGKAELTWNTNFVPVWQGRYTAAQKWIDNEVIMQTEKFVPLLIGMLKMSAILGTDIGSGTVQYIAPYAKLQYYRGRRKGTSKTGALRGRLWFERAKAVYKDHWIQGARKIAATGKQ